MFEFLDFDYMSDGEIDLIIKGKIPANDKIGYVPIYDYKITQHGSDLEIGHINIRIGYNEKIFFGGHIGYGINEDYRGKHYAAKACEILKQVALAHGLEKLIITCNPENIASRKTCERIGGSLTEIVDLPKDNDMYIEGERSKCIYEIMLRK